MKIKKLSLTHLWLIMIIITLISPGCSVQPAVTPLDVEATAVPLSSTPVQPTIALSPPTSTTIPTASPVPGQLSYLPSPADLPSGFEWSLSWESQQPVTNTNIIDIAQTKYYTDAGWFTSEIRIATTPWKKGARGVQLGGTGTLVDTVLVGDFSEAYVISEDPPTTEFNFGKGNVLVVLHGPISVDDAVKLAQNLEQRIPENLAELTPITFPDMLEPAAAAEFSNWMIGECTDDNDVTEPLTVIGGGFGYCMHFDWVAQEPYSGSKMEYAIFDLNKQEYVIKYSTGHRFGMLFLPGNPGNYELRVAKDDALIAVLPFEVR